MCLESIASAVKCAEHTEHKVRKASEFYLCGQQSSHLVAEAITTNGRELYLPNVQAAWDESAPASLPMKQNKGTRKNKDEKFGNACICRNDCSRDWMCQFKLQDRPARCGEQRNGTLLCGVCSGEWQARQGTCTIARGFFGSGNGRRGF